MRKCCFIIPFLLIISLMVPSYGNAMPFSPSIDIYSEGVYMVNLNSDEVVYKKNENSSLYPASLTKIMTAVVLLEHYKDNPEALATTKVSAPSSAYNDFAGMSVSTADIRAGEEVSYRDLLYALMLPSACEAGNIIAYNIGGGNIQTFVKMMNDKAAELGMNNTHFENAHGLHDPAQVSTPHDLAILTKYALTFPEFVEISNTKSYTLPATSVHPNGTYLRHTNAMLFAGNYYYKYAKGIKTGTLAEAGRCLISTASRDGVDYLIVTMNAPMKDQDGNNKFYNCLDHITLYEWAYKSLTFQELLNKDSEIDHIEVKYGKNGEYVNLKPKESYTALWTKGNLPKAVPKYDSYAVAPIKEGQILGKLDLMFNGEVVFSTDLVAANSVDRNLFDYKLTVAKQFFSSAVMKYTLLGCLAIILLYTFFFFKGGKKRKKYRFKSKVKRF